ncbi:MAG: hypothetical protein QM754_03870 [Tepidisphaeraceae bacterium]
MAHHTHTDLSHEVTRMRPAGKALGPILMVGGIVAVLVAFFVSPKDSDDVGRRFWFAYLFGLAAITCVSGASLIFTLVNHLVRSGWITNVRRILETFAVQIGLVLVLAIPLIVVTLGKHGTVYSWAKPSDTPIVHHGGAHEEAHDAEHDHAAHKDGDGHDHSKDEHAAETKPEAHGEAKHEEAGGIEYPNEQVQPGVTRPYDAIIAQKTHVWLNPSFWAVRVFAYLAVLTGIAYYYWSNSVKQDLTGDIDINAKLSYRAGPLVLATGLIFTFIAFDVFMSLDPHWFSTMYGVYLFASGTQAMWALISLFVLTLQARGYLKQSITQEHRHDLGKFLWAFIFFFGYIAFSQYMLQWYANLPEETFFFDKRGYSQAHPNGYTPLVVALLFGRFVIPFLGLVSRHVKRNRFGLGFWAVWLLCFFVVDMYLLVIPEYSYTPVFGLPEILAFVGIVGLWFGNVIRVLGNHELRPVRDPRVHESLALQNF